MTEPPTFYDDDICFFCEEERVEEGSDEPLCKRCREDCDFWDTVFYAVPIAGAIMLAAIITGIILLL